LLSRIKSSKSLADQAYLAIKDEIVKNRFKPKEVLLEENLAASLGISRTPLRVALKKLEFERLIYVNSSKQAVVADVTREDMIKMFVVRLGVEPVLIRLACRLMDEETLIKLDENLALTQAAVDRGDLRTVVEYEMKFDAILAECVGNEHITPIISSIGVYMERYFLLSLKHYSMCPVALAEHREMVRAIKERDGDKAAASSAAHLRRMASDLDLPLPI
jgi:DNA-binding GntR family transcriptional regulator